MLEIVIRVINLAGGDQIGLCIVDTPVPMILFTVTVLYLDQILFLPGKRYSIGYFITSKWYG